MKYSSLAAGTCSGVLAACDKTLKNRNGWGIRP
jgi:hypothetical protein